MIKLKIVEQYQELIECDSSDISYFWKSTAIISYAVSLMTSYTCAILYHIFWYKICGGNCYIWADVKKLKKIQKVLSIAMYKEFGFVNNITSDWTKEIYVQFKIFKYCKFFHLICLLSFSVATILLVMFTICGKGGYYRSLQVYVAPWRIALPALVCNLFMIVLTLAASHHFDAGYNYFNSQLLRRFFEITKLTPHFYITYCKILEDFLNRNNTVTISLCNLYTIIQTCAWAMAWSWIASFAIICLRIITCADFNLLNIKIYEISGNKFQRETVINKIFQDSANLTLQTENLNDQDNTEKNKVL